MRAHAFVTCIIRNDSYLPGALVQAHALRRQETTADLVCLVTGDVSTAARAALGTLFDRVIPVEPIVCRQNADQRRQYLAQVLTRVNALRLGADGDLGCAYEKIVLLDADVLPLRCYDHLFLVEPPAGIVNERADLFKRTDGSRRYVAGGSLAYGRWAWHHHYRDVPHGARVPREITDRVLADPSNYGINAALLVLRPSLAQYTAISRCLAAGAGPAARLASFRWPDMQFLTAFWSGQWRNVDVCFAGLSGYPDLSVLFGTHFAGPKPWSIRSRSVVERFSRFPDFRRWYAEYAELVAREPALRRVPSLVRLERFVSSREFAIRGECGTLAPARSR